MGGRLVRELLGCDGKEKRNWGGEEDEEEAEEEKKRTSV